MPCTTRTNITLEQLRIYDGDELISDGSDPSTYTVCETAEQLKAAFAAARRCRILVHSSACPRLKGRASGKQMGGLHITQLINVIVVPTQ